MAPVLDGEDDFVLTISDDDPHLPLEVEEESVERPVSGLKRKRNAKDKLAKGKEKNQKRAKKNKNDVESSEDELDPLNRQRNQEDDGAMDPDFEFQVGELDSGVIEDFDGWGTTKINGGDKKGVDIDDIIARRRERKQKAGHVGANGSSQASDLGSENEVNGKTSKKISEVQYDTQNDGNEDDELLAPDGFGMGAAGLDEEDEEQRSEVEGEDEEVEDEDEEEESVASPVAHPDDEQSDISEDEEEKARQDAFFAPEPKIVKGLSTQDISKTFQNMSLSRPILRGLASVGFTDPTPIQAKTIPVALLGKDVVGGAVTGSGKTAAFMIPILERLLYRPKRIPTSRVIILMPTRELAVQVFNVAKKLASFTDVTFCQLVGGFSLREQEVVLKTRPDVIVATPGRFIDIMRNSASFTVDTIEILVLDEADRMLEDGFADELNEILTTIPKSRQTMLFSATMTSNVDKLIRVGLNKPVRLMVDSQKQTVSGLIQEFVRLRPGKEDKRLAYLLHLCTRVYTDRCIVFFRQKKEAHRVRIIFGLFGFKAGELHGSMTQEQRIASVEAFRNSDVTHLLATDVASRGLDIKNVSSVLNYEAPQSHEIYLHRVGRTARAGRTGRACTIAAEPDRKVVKAAVKTGKAQGAKIVSRTVESIEIDAWEAKLEGIQEEVDEILLEEKEERALNQVDMRLKKGENIMAYEEEIMSRPKRTWFETEAEKKAAKTRGREELNGSTDSRKSKKRKLSNKEKKRLDDKKERTEGRVWKKNKDAGNVKFTGKGGKRPQKSNRKGANERG